MVPGRRSLLALLTAPFVLAFACAPAASPPSVPPPTTAYPASPPAAPAPAPAAWDPNMTGPDEAALDRSVAPCDDMYQFACGGWMKATPIPDDEASWVRSFSVLHEENLKSLRGILERDAAGNTDGDAYGKQLGDFWSSCADEAAVEKRGLVDLKSELDRIRAVHDAKSLVQELAHLHAIGVGVAFGFDSEVDMKDATRMIAGVSQGGLGLPERDYYFRTDQRSKDIRAAYEKHVGKTLELIGEAPAQAAADATAILKWETDLAGASMTNVELRDPQKVYHLLNLDGIKAIAPDIAWDAYLAGVGFPSITAINVGQPDFVKKLDGLVKGASTKDWQVYLRWHLARSMSPYLTRKLVDEWFHFRQVLTGTKVLQPRWKRCVGFVDHLMGEALAQPFVKVHLGEDGKRAAEEMVAEIEQSMKLDLESLPWMDGATRTKAEAKLGKILNKIGYPAKWRSYEGLVIDRASFITNIQNGTLFEFHRQLDKVGKPVDKDEWEMSPPTVNAYYEPTMNEMVFPAGILEAPFYAKTQSPPLNFGGIGMVVGHELTHGFDDEGRQFDADGNLKDWWTPAVSTEFDRRAACVEHQYDDYVAVDDVHLKGKLTLGENIADLGGVKLSFASFERAQKEKPAPSIAGFTPEQQFFLGFAQSWCANYRSEALRLLATTNPHSPPKFRVLGPLSNLPEFAKAFSCKEDAPMVRPKDKRCEVW